MGDDRCTCEPSSDADASGVNKLLKSCSGCCSLGVVVRVKIVLDDVAQPALRSEQIVSRLPSFETID